MNRWYLAAVLCLAFAATALAAGKVYMWTDDKGVPHIGTTPPEGSKPAVTAPSAPAPPSDQASSAEQIEIFVTDWCPYCTKATAYLKSKGKAFKEYNIQHDAEAARRKQQLSPGGAVPFAVICGQKLLGFSPPSYDRALAACK